MNEKLRQIKFCRLSSEEKYLILLFDKLNYTNNNGIILYYNNDVICMKYSFLSKKLYMKTEILIDLIDYTRDLVYLEECIIKNIKMYFDIEVSEVHGERNL